MITVFKNNGVVKTEDVVRINDLYFNKYTVDLLDERAKDIIKKIDSSEMISQYVIGSRFDGTRLNIDRLSTGCKTALNVLYNPDIVFDISECGENALEVIYSLSDGKVFCEYPMISFDMSEVRVADKNGIHDICNYEELRQWWKNED
jgi:hypothetical protein